MNGFRIKYIFYLAVISLFAASKSADSSRKGICSQVFQNELFQSYRKETNTCYLVFNHKRSFGASRKRCSLHGAAMVVINDTEEREFVYRIQRSHRGTKLPYWIGLRSKPKNGSDELEWQWDDGTTYQSGDGGFQDEADQIPRARRRCVYINRQGFYSTDSSCGKFRQPICEKELPWPETTSITTEMTTEDSSAAPLRDIMLGLTTTLGPDPLEVNTTEDTEVASKEHQKQTSDLLLYIIIASALILVTILACIVLVVLYKRYRRNERFPRDIPGLGETVLTKAAPLPDKLNPQISNSYYNFGPSLAGPITGGPPDRNIYENWSVSSGTNSDVILSKQDDIPRNYASRPISDKDNLSERSTIPASSGEQSDHQSDQTTGVNDEDNRIEHTKIGGDEYAIPSLRRKQKDEQREKHESNDVVEYDSESPATSIGMVNNKS